jgi:arginine decarboxylase
MASSTSNLTKVDNFFSSSAARFDRWRELNAKAQTWAAAARSGSARPGRAAVEAALADVRPLEDFFAYPGARLMKTLAERIATDDALGTARLVRRLSGALLTESYRYESGQWETSDDENDSAPERLAQTFEGGEVRRPYFEALFVTPAPAGSAAKLAHEIRRLRRVEDAMIYEPVFVGSVEDAMLATILNGKIQSVVIFDGIPVPSQHDVPLLRDLLTTYQHLDASSEAPLEIGITLAKMIKRVRPELDIYLMSDRNVEKLAGDPAASMIRRVFYEVEEMMEVHLNIL